LFFFICLLYKKQMLLNGERKDSSSSEANRGDLPEIPLLYPPPIPTPRPPSSRKFVAPTGVTSSNYTRRVFSVPGSSAMPLRFEGLFGPVRKLTLSSECKINKNIGIKFKDTVFHIEENSNVFMEFLSCQFESSVLLGNLNNIKQERSSTRNLLQAPVQKKQVRLPGTAENPIVFNGIVFAYLDMDLGGMFVNYIQCRFIQCVFNNGTNSVFQGCEFSSIQTEFTQMDYEFTIHAKDDYNNVEAIVGKVYPSLPSLFNGNSRSKWINQIVKKWKNNFTS
jgi:hypothetical protein